LKRKLINSLKRKLSLIKYYSLLSNLMKYDILIILIKQVVLINNDLNSLLIVKKLIWCIFLIILIVMNLNDN